jgi:hypothetical protein
VRVRIRGRRFAVSLSTAGSRSLAVQARLSRAAARRLGARRLTFSFRLTTVVDGVPDRRTVRATIRGGRRAP